MIHNWKPLPNYLDIQYSSVHGKGLFAIEPIEKDKILGLSCIIVNKETIRTPLQGWINHSDNPNVIIYHSHSVNNIHYYNMKTLKDIQQGEELFNDYRKATFCCKDDNCNLKIEFE